MLAGDYDATPALYTPDALLDVNVPEWRYQLQGADAIRRQFDEWHPLAPELVEWRERTTDRGLPCTAPATGPRNRKRRPRPH